MKAKSKELFLVFEFCRRKQTSILVITLSILSTFLSSCTTIPNHPEIGKTNIIEFPYSETMPIKLIPWVLPDIDGKPFPSGRWINSGALYFVTTNKETSLITYIIQKQDYYQPVIESELLLLYFFDNKGNLRKISYEKHIRGGCDILRGAKSKEEIVNYLGKPSLIFSSVHTWEGKNISKKVWDDEVLLYDYPKDKKGFLLIALEERNKNIWIIKLLHELIFPGEVLWSGVSESGAYDYEGYTPTIAKRRLSPGEYISSLPLWESCK